LPNRPSDFRLDKNKKDRESRSNHILKWRARQDSNLRPSDS
jgi:hypothetical protein